MKQAIGKRLGTFAFWLILLLVFGSVGWFVMLEPITDAIGNWRQARDYQPVSATVVARDGKDTHGSFRWYAARYEVAGKSYETSRMSVLETPHFDVGYNAAVNASLNNALETNKPVTVWVSPRRADVALASRDFPLQSLWAKALIGMGFAVFAVAGAVGVSGSLLNAAWYRKWHDAIAIWGFAAAWCGFSYTMFALLVSDSGDWGAIAGVGFFVLIGALMQWAALHISLFGTRQNATAVRGKLSRSTPARSSSKAKNRISGDVKRGGLGGRGDNFDKD
jgi:hypothetical protein